MWTSHLKSSQLRIWKIQICTQLTNQKISHRSTVLTVPRGSLAIKQPFKTFGKGFTIVTDDIFGILMWLFFPDNFPQGGWLQLLAVGESDQWSGLWLKCQYMVPSIMKKALNWLSYFWRWWQLISGNQPGEPDWRPSELLRHPHHRYPGEIFWPPSSSSISSPPPSSIQARPPVIFDWLCISRHSVSASFSILLVCSTCRLPSLSLYLFLTQPSRGREWWHQSPSWYPSTR